MHRSEQTLISLQFVGECFIGRPHVLHFFVYQKLDLIHVILVTTCHLIEIVVKQLQSLRKSIYFASDLVSQVADTCDILEHFLLLVFEVL